MTRHSFGRRLERPVMILEHGSHHTVFRGQACHQAQALCRSPIQVEW